ncbi:hypothetical protein PC129_g11921 [Phytophthora cactorum]|uniref:Uncharacterized protein n=1 Tax=Phytophthora cactorum TaxID=29920 RepID=A0A8T1I1Z4_9STRA|nr:hypothetical protein Pcac1_g12264 [Phytophthora cactorum]KAG2903120.1 hypothetical protein PC114_g12390 [Phytophthora cactorum]KAG2928273.1 hypothetical protein PC117_g14359 [Phytophthora cactorum]KAG3007379.1 hypothetical protein PC119_g14584 [Phytophthora cactorum]KAG3154608.1 hypothetical protein C6341_g15618 [Phytophthora cactorum]
MFSNKQISEFFYKLPAETSTTSSSSASTAAASFANRHPELGTPTWFSML